ncbi:MAG: FlgD immunoglobulin-like domain containing protein [candidate division KSB1 bacterium]|jgi:hypothetical protein|nr:FlgD immunoglobulin-like domain containing protein [candidate division KSB1 bacterium]
MRYTVLILTLLFSQMAFGDELLIPDCSFRGEQNAGRIGYYLSSAGDVNNDGFGDFMIGSYHTSLYGWNSGAVFLILGKSTIDWQLNTSLDVADAVFRGKTKYEMVGYNMAGEGDFNGDGIDDLIIGGPGNWEKYPTVPGSAYIIFGKEEADWGDDCILPDQADFEIVGENLLDQLGYANAFIGDLDGDGCDDILCAASFRTQTREWEGVVYLIMGRRSFPNRVVNVSNVAAASFIYPEYHGVVGSAVDGVGDVNQDGQPDFLIGAAGIGTSFLILGRPQADWGYNFDLENADCIFTPESKGDDAGWQVKKAGDLNQDGYPDFLISGLQIKWEAGKVYVIFGRENWPSQIPLSQADASYYGEGTYHHAGVSINGIHDYDGDGIDDFLVGARYYKHNDPGTRDYHRGKTYLIKGKRNGWSRNVALKDIQTYYLGEDSVACSGWGVSSAGDVNGDMRMDFIVAAPWHDDGRDAGRTVGEVYLFLADYPLRTIGGKTHYFSGDVPVPDVQLSLSGDVETNIASDANGSYLFEISHGSNFIVTPFRGAEDDIAPGVLSIYDAALAARHAVLLDTLGNSAQMAADVDEDGDITLYDASLIAHYAVGLWGGEESGVGVWRFDPEQRSYQSQDLPLLNENYECILTGDVSGNWRPGNSGLLKRSLPEKSIVWKEDGSISLPFDTGDMNGMLSAEIHLSYNATALEFVGVRRTALTEDFRILVNDQLKGELKLGLYGMKEVAKQGSICYLDFKSAESGTMETMIRIDKYQINDRVSETGDIFVRHNGKETSDHVSKTFTLHNYPNPFNPETVIHYNLKERSRIELVILNSLGHRVRTLERRVAEAGEHRTVWRGMDDAGNRVGSGLYIAFLKTDLYSLKRKMLKLK